MSSCPLFDGPFVFLRHGETEVNRLGLTAGMTDVVLNERGRQQARAAAAELVGRGLDAVYSSPLKRALATAQCVARRLGLPVVTIRELAERNWGAQEGKPRRARDRAATPPGGEGLDEFTRRTLTGLEKIRGGGLPLIVAHSGTYRVICSHFGIPVDAQVENCRPMRFSPPGSPGGSWRVEAL